jgi:hypothetical protein
METTTSEHSRLLHTGQDYVVYGILLKKSPKYLVFEPDNLSFPFFVESEEVDLVDARSSRYWFYSPPLASTDLHSASPPLISFEVMVRDRTFYQALVDGEPAAVSAWEAARRLIDAESGA